VSTRSIRPSAYRCSACDQFYALEEPIWRCPRCAGPLELDPPGQLAPDDIDWQESGIWRYAAALPFVESEHRLSLGESGTPLVPSLWHGQPVWFKHEFLQPTGSYKDRGAALLMSLLQSLGVEECIEDSSGNAAAAISAYAARARIRCRIFAPAHASPGKLAQTRAHGAALVAVSGTRDQVAKAAIAAAADGGRYAGHNWHPLFLAGVATLGPELVFGAVGGVPDTIIAPVGYGNLLLGIWEGLSWLRRAGALPVLPRLVAVQTEAFPAVVRAWEAGTVEPVPVETGATVAEGVECALPIRGAAIMNALRETSGTALAVSEHEIAVALRELVAQGIYVEPTSAVALAGLSRLITAGELDPAGRHILILTGSGQKAAAAIEATLGQPQCPMPARVSGRSCG
jgi:threonine synthase